MDPVSNQSGNTCLEKCDRASIQVQLDSHDTVIAGVVFDLEAEGFDQLEHFRVVSQYLAEHFIQTSTAGILDQIP
jgi:hypothetical protein